MKAYTCSYKLKTFRVLLMYYDVTFTQNMLILSLKSYLFLIQMQTLLLFLLLFFECKMCGQKDITAVMSFQLYVDRVGVRMTRCVTFARRVTLAQRQNDTVFYLLVIIFIKK